MKKEWRDIISKTVGVEPALVSAQQRKRLYWTNIPVKGTQRYKMIENAWTVDVISWFFKFLFF